MEIKVTPGLPGSARVEYFACRADVEAMLAQGHTARSVYEHLKDHGRVTCSYSAFCDYVRGGGVRQHSKGRKKPPVVPAKRELQGPRVIKADYGNFPDPKTMDPKDAL